MNNLSKPHTRNTCATAARIAFTPRKIIFLLFFCGIVFFANEPASAQQNRWLFVGRNDNGSASYLENTALKQIGNQKQTWVKEVYRDRSYRIMLVEWQCREQRLRVLEGTGYAETGAFLGKEGVTPWTSVVPDSVSENYYKTVCRSVSPTTPTASSKQLIAVVVSQTANVREAPAANSLVIQKAARGKR